MEYTIEYTWENCWKIGGFRMIFAKIKRAITKKGNLKFAVQECMLKKSLPQLAAFHKWHYEKMTGRKLDYEHPQNICEKVQQLLIYDAQPYKTKWADKYLAKSLATEVLGEGHVAKLYGVWKSFDEIDFDSLPDSFVLKANHGQSMNIIVKDKNNFDKAKAKRKFDHWMKINFGATFKCELQYRKIEPRIIAEEYLSPKNGRMIDYKTTCILGEPEKIACINKSNNTLNAYCFENGKIVPEKLRNSLQYKFDTENLSLPDNIDQIVEFSKKLSAGMDFVRVDLYDIDGTIYFGELTFTDDAFVGHWLIPEKWENISDRAKAWAKTGLPEHITEL